MRNYLSLLLLTFAISCGPAKPPLPPYDCEEIKKNQAELPAAITNPDPNTGHKFGFLQAKGGKLFYALMAAKQDDANTPVVVWLNGGPGSSSQIGLYYEMGPYRINPDDLSLYENDYAWNDKANMLYIDQPFGVGYSTEDAGVEPVRNQDQASDAMRDGLKDFFRQNPKFKGRPFYLFGESFAGTYIPWIAKKIIDDTSADKITLTGIGIGDGTIDRLEISKSVPEYAYNKALIDQGGRTYLEKKLVPACIDQVMARRKDGTTATGACDAIDFFVAQAATYINVYDVHYWGQYDLRPMTCLLNSSKAKAAFGQPESAKFSQSNENVFVRLRPEGSGGETASYVVEALKKDVKVLIYSGESDLLIPHLGTESIVRRIGNGDYGSWAEKGMADFATEFKGYDTALANQNDAAYRWRLKDADQRIAGAWVTKGKLTYALVKDAGHLVPLDTPEASKLMFDCFLEDKDCRQ